MLLNTNRCISLCSNLLGLFLSLEIYAFNNIVPILFRYTLCIYNMLRDIFENV